MLSARTGFTYVNHGPRSENKQSQYCTHLCENNFVILVHCRSSL